MRNSSKMILLVIFTFVVFVALRFSEPLLNEVLKEKAKDTVTTIISVKDPNSPEGKIPWAKVVCPDVDQKYVDKIIDKCVENLGTCKDLAERIGCELKDVE